MESASELPSSRVAFDEVYKAGASSALPPRPSTAVKATSRALAGPPEVASSLSRNCGAEQLATGKANRPPRAPESFPGAPTPAAHAGSPTRRGLVPAPPALPRAPPRLHPGPYLGGEAGGPGRRTRTPRASEGEAERPRRGAERCTRPTAPAAPGRGGRARARGTHHAPGPLPAPPARAPDAPAPRGPRRRPGSGGCAVRGGDRAPAARRRPETSPSPGMVCPVGNAHAPLLSHQHKVLPHCGESLEARDDSDTDNFSPNSTESRSQRLVVAPYSQGLALPQIQLREAVYAHTRIHTQARIHTCKRAGNACSAGLGT